LKLYQKIKLKFPDINCVKGEDLNIQRNIAILIKSRWNDLGKYPTAEMVAKSLGITVRDLYRFSVNLELPKRKEIKNERKIRQILRKAS